MINQTRFGGSTALIRERGNCFAGCELDVVDAPDEKDKHWLDIFHQRLVDVGLPYRLLMLKPTAHVLKTWVRDALYIASGPSPRGDYLHSCVYKKGELVHDPFPGGSGFKNQQVDDIVVLIWIGSNAN
jgi:hypothetical protein